MSEPVKNVQMEDVLSSIRRLVSEEIGQSGLKPLEKKKSDSEPDIALVLSPAQKIRQDAADQGEDLWDETAELAPKAPAPLWWHREFSEENEDVTAEEAEATPEPEVLDEPPVAEAEEIAHEPIFSTRNPFARSEEPEEEPQPVAEAPANDDPLPEFKSRLGGAIADLEAALADTDEDWEAEEGDQIESPGLEFDEMPWSSAVEVEDIVVDEFLERETLAAHTEDDVLTPDETREETVEEAIAAEMPEEQPFDDVEDILDAMPLDGPSELEDEPEVMEAIEGVAEDAEPVEAQAELQADPEDIPFSFRPGERLFERLNRGPGGKTTEVEEEFDDTQFEEVLVQPETEILSADLDYEREEEGLVLDEDMLRQMVHDIVRQELQGVLGERITRNVRKLVRREIQRAFTELGQ